MTKIYAPEGNVAIDPVVLAPLPERLAGLRLAILDNGKPNAAELMQSAAEALAEGHGIEWALYKKGSAATPCENELFGEICAGADLVLTGTAD